MTLDLASTETFDATAVLAEVAAAFRAPGSRPYPAPEKVVRALLELEKTTKKERSAYPLPALVGGWQLCFVTGTRKVRERAGIALGKGRYLPPFIRIFLSLQSPEATPAPPNRGQIGNQVQVGPLRLALSGPVKYLNPKNLLAFDFTRLQVSLFNQALYKGSLRGGESTEQNFHSQSIAQQAFFAFFAVTPDFIAARGRGGGLALWIRQEGG